MGKPTYQAASIVAPTVEAHFARHLAHARERGEQHLAPQPDAKTIEAIIDAAFWASFRPEEGRFPKISLAYLSPDQTRQPLLFERPLPLTRAVLTKLAPAVERPEIHLGVWSIDNQLQVWGATRSIPSYCFVLEDIEPGLLVIKHRRIEGFGKYPDLHHTAPSASARCTHLPLAADRAIATMPLTDAMPSSRLAPTIGALLSTTSAKPSTWRR